LGVTNSGNQIVTGSDDFYFKYCNGTENPGASLSISVINFGEDMFLMEIFLACISGWVIVKWEDTNGDSFVNGPEDGDTYTLIAQG
jgi:hypothetical protein